jgi:purine-binding chemotaxis protein CheW
VEHTWGGSSSGGAGQPDPQGASAEALREALRSLGGGAGGMAAGSLSPEQIADLAQRAGLADSARAADLARLLGRSPDTLSAPSLGPQYIIFAVGDLECTVPAEAVQGVERLTEVAPVPNTAPWLLGVVQFRGAILSVVDLRAFLGLPPTDLTQRSRMIVVGAPAMTMGLMVDAVLEMRPNNADSRVAASGGLPDWIAPYAAGTIELGGRHVILIDLQRLLFAEKMGHYQDDGT